MKDAEIVGTLGISAPAHSRGSGGPVLPAKDWVPAFAGTTGLTTRRAFLGGAATLAGGVLLACAKVESARATPATMNAAIKKVIGEAPLRKGKVTIDVPPLVENGNTVPVTISVESPMTAAEHVKAIHMFNEKNPQPNVI